MYYISRILCYLKMKQWEQLKADALHVVNSVSQNTTEGAYGRFFLGIAEMELQSYQSSIRHLQEGMLSYIIMNTTFFVQYTLLFISARVVANDLNLNVDHDISKYIQIVYGKIN